MDKAKLISIVLVIIGAAFILASLTPARRTGNKVPAELRERWLVILYLMIFFFAGYVFFDIVLITGLKFPIELVTGSVFLGGAIFVFIIIHLAQRTILNIREKEEELKSLNESLEHRVAERTRELQRSYDFVQTVINSMSDPIAIINAETFQIVGVNSPFLREYGLEEHEVVGKTCFSITHDRSEPCSPPHDSCPLKETVLTGKHASAEHLHHTKGGTMYEEILTSPIKDDEGRIIQVVHAARNITDRKRAEEQIRHLAYYDHLTGLPNRTFYKELMERALKYADRHKNVMASLFIDLDSFKRINDTLGHGVGDQILQIVSERLVKALRKSDYIARSGDDTIENTVSRLGGDEFIVLLTEISRDRDAALVARRLLRDLSKPCTAGGHEIFITASIGISLYPSDGDDVDTLLKNADIAMYYAKEQGKNNFQFYSPSMNTAVIEHLTMEYELRKALDHDEFVLHYQPKIDVQTRAAVGFEALICWNHPVRGLISPLEFIPLAEDTGLIIPIGEWVLRTVCSQIDAWCADGLPVLPVAVNLSKRQFGQRDLVKNISRILSGSGTDPVAIELDIAESAIIHDAERAMATMSALKAMGIKILLDDFGTGYSSLDSLRRYPLDALKIGQSFISGITGNQDDLTIVKAIIIMAHSLSLKIVAEGVEAEEQFAILRDLGCDEVQGYLFSRPRPAGELLPFFHSPIK